jgi:hypothetical protein
MNGEAMRGDNNLSRCSGVKALLERLNMSYTERQEGNVVIIEIKANRQQVHPLNRPVRSSVDTSHFNWPQE